MEIKNLAAELYGAIPTSGLYHYTSLTGMMSIVKDGALFASDMRYFNDSSELVRTADLVHSTIFRRLTKGAQNEVALTQFDSWLRGRLLLGDMLFVGSFTTKGNLLSQWRGYCPIAKGVSLGFEPAHLKKKALDQGFSLGRCIYAGRDQRDVIDKLIDEIERLCANIGPESDPKKRHPDNSFHSVFEGVERDILQIAALIKDYSFNEEQEWRVVSKPVSDYVKESVMFREGQSMLIPYFAFKLPANQQGGVDLKHVVVGPTPHPVSATESILRYLNNRKSYPKEHISYCDIPYRGW